MRTSVWSSIHDVIFCRVCETRMAEKYGGDDRVDEWLLNQVVKRVNDDELDSVATDLRVPESTYSNTTSTKNRRFKVRDNFCKEHEIKGGQFGRFLIQVINFVYKNLAIFV